MFVCPSGLNRSALVRSGTVYRVCEQYLRLLVPTLAVIRVFPIPIMSKRVPKNVVRRLTDSGFEVIAFSDTVGTELELVASGIVCSELSQRMKNHWS